MATWPLPLETKHLRLRPTRRGDEEWIISLFVDPEVRKYLGGAMTEAGAQERTQLSDKPLWGHFALTLIETKNAIGSLSFARKTGPWELSFQLRKDSWGKGYAREAIEVAVNWFFEETGESQVCAFTQTANERACRLLERLGAKITEELTYGDLPVLKYTFVRPPRK